MTVGGPESRAGEHWAELSTIFSNSLSSADWNNSSTQTASVLTNDEIYNCWTGMDTLRTYYTVSPTRSWPNTLCSGPNISKTAGDAALQQSLVCCEAVRSAMLATACILISLWHMKASTSADKHACMRLSVRRGLLSAGFSVFPVTVYPTWQLGRYIG